MIFKNYSKKALLQNIFFWGVFLYHCSPGNIQRKAGVEILKGDAQFQREVSELIEPRGILPSNDDFEFEGAVRKDPSKWNEFFVFDERVSLMILSVSPKYFVKIDSREFYSHLNREYLQIKKGKNSADKTKILSGLPFFKEVGDYLVEIYFTPKELNYSNKNLIKQSNEKPPRPDLWRLMEASEKVILFTPEFEETQIHREFLVHELQHGLKRLIYTNSSPINISRNYININKILNFTFIIGKDIRTTDNLLDGRELAFEDEFNLTKDFISLFSLPLGDANDFTNKKRYLDNEDGIVVVIRGDLKRFENFFSREGIDLQRQNSIAFDLLHAIPVNENRIDLLFSEAPNKTDAMNASNYCIDSSSNSECIISDIEIINISLDKEDKNKIILNTFPQDMFAIYKVFVDQNIRNQNGSKKLSIHQKILSPRVLLTEINHSEHIIEMLFTRPGPITDFKIRIGDRLVYSFPISENFQKNDIILLHLQDTGNNEDKSSGEGESSGYDFYLPPELINDNVSITNSQNSIGVYDMLNHHNDYIAWTNTASSSSILKKVTAQIENSFWTSLGITPTIFDLVDSSNQNTMLCLHRKNEGADSNFIDTHSALDWQGGICGLGENQDSSQRSNSKADHLVISEVGMNFHGIAECDYVEIYNPTDESIDLKGIFLQRNTASLSSRSLIEILISNETRILRPGQFFLITNDDWMEKSCGNEEEGGIIPDKLSDLSITSHNVLSLYSETQNPGCPDNVIDKVAFGDNTCSEGYPIGNFSKAIERKAFARSTPLTMSLIDSKKGNSQDSGNNLLDFIKKDIQEPQNLSSDLETP